MKFDRIAHALQTPLALFAQTLILAVIVLFVSDTPADAGIAIMGVVAANNTNGPGRSLFAAYLGRNQGPELFHVQAVTPNTQTLIPKVLSISRPLEAILIRWTGRVAITVNNYDAVSAEGPQTILNRIRIFGTYKGVSLTPIDITGATAFVWPRLFQNRGNTMTIGGVRQAEPGQPFNQIPLNFGNIGVYDLDIWYLVPTWPMVALATRAQNIVPYCWQPRDWNDSLQVQINTGDATSLGTPNAASVTTFSAYGVGTGTPSIRIYTRYLTLGPLRTGFRSACVVRNENTITAGLTAAANNVRLAVLTKQKTTSLVIKTGRLLAGTTAGISVFSDLRDGLLDITQILNDNRPVRNNQDNLTFKEHAGMQFDTVLPEGYLTMPFVDSQSPRTAYRGDLPQVVAPGASFELVSNIIESNAASAVNLVQEQIVADADDPYWLATR